MLGCREARGRWIPGWAGCRRGQSRGGMEKSGHWERHLGRTTWGMVALQQRNPAWLSDGSQADTTVTLLCAGSSWNRGEFSRVGVSGEVGIYKLNIPYRNMDMSLEGRRRADSHQLLVAAILCCSSKEHLISKEIGLFPLKGACWRGEFLGLTPDLLNQKLWGGTWQAESQ